MFRYVLFTLLLVFSAGVLAGTLEGLWQKQGEAVWIEFTANSTTGVVVRNDKKPEAVGFEVVRDLEVSQTEDNSWKADVFAAHLPFVLVLDLLRLRHYILLAYYCVIGLLL